MKGQTFFKPHFCGNAIRGDKLRDALREDDFEKFKILVNSDKHKNDWARTGIFLYYVIEDFRNLEVFNYIINMDNFNIDSVDSQGRNLLMNLAFLPSEKGRHSLLLGRPKESGYDQFALALIEKGTNIFLADKEGFTYLHCATLSNENLKIGQLLIEKGIDVNAQANNGTTPLYLACQYCKDDWIYMLLYYGADPTIQCNQGILPLVMLSPYLGDKKTREKANELEELLWNYTFDEGDSTTISLPTLVKALVSRGSLFEKIVKIASHVEYDIFDLEYLCENIFRCNPKHLKLFVGSYDYVVKDLLASFPLLKILLDECECEGKICRSNSELKQIIDVFLQSDYITEFVQISDDDYPTISNFVKVFNDRYMFVDEKEIAKCVYLMLSYGLNLTTQDLDTVYKFYPDSELFKFLSKISYKDAKTIQHRDGKNYAAI